MEQISTTDLNPSPPVLLHASPFVTTNKRNSLPATTDCRKSLVAAFSSITNDLLLFPLAALDVSRMSVHKAQ